MVVNTPETTASGNLVGAPTRFAALVTLLRWLGALARAITNRGEVRTLLELSDRELKDIGLTRNDVISVLDEPLVRDPSMILSVRSVERRSRIRAMAVSSRQLTHAPSLARVS